MLHTSLCDLLEIDVPIVQAGMGVFTGAELVAAVSNAGALGSLGASLRQVDELRDELDRIRQLTDRPFAVNFTLNSPPDPDAIAAALDAAPKVMSFALGDPTELVGTVHAAGVLVMHQVTTPRQAQAAISAGVDILIAQGSEAGGFGGEISVLPLVPQALDIAASVPVVAAGGIADGRGVAAMIVLGAEGANIGTRFLASMEAPISSRWKQLIVDADSDETVKFDVWTEIFPTAPAVYEVSPRTLHTRFVDRWNHASDDARQHADELQAEFMSAIRSRTMDEIMPWAGESVGLIDDIRPAGELVHQIARDAQSLLGSAPTR